MEEKTLYNVEEKKVKKLSATEQNAIERKTRKACTDPFARQRALALFMEVPVNKIAFLEEVEMLGRKLVDKMTQNFDYLFLAPVILCYWASAGYLIHIDGWHRTRFFSDIREKYIPANIIDIEHYKGRELSYEEVRTECCDRFLRQKAACAALKAQDCYYPELFCSDDKVRTVAWAMKAVEDAGFSFIPKGTNKEEGAKNGLISYTLLREIAKSFQETGTLFAAPIASAMKKCGNDEMRALKKLLGIIEEKGELTDNVFMANAQRELIAYLDGKTMVDAIGKMTASRGEFTSCAAEALYSLLTEQKEVA